MMRKFTVYTLVLFSLYQISAQDENVYQFEYREMELKEITSPFVKSHYLGDEVANMMQILRETYTYKVIDELTRVEEKVIEKQKIFNSVAKVSKFLKKEIKSGRITKAEAKKVMQDVLVVAINIRYQETEQLESELWKIKSAQAITDLFTERISFQI